MSATMACDEKLAERVRAILAERRGVTEKRLLGTLAFMVNGATCRSVSRDGLLVRIDAEEREQLLRDPFASPMKLGARTMNGFLRIALEGLRTRARVEKWIARGIARVEAGRKEGPSRRAQLVNCSSAQGVPRSYGCEAIEVAGPKISRRPRRS